MPQSRPTTYRQLGAPRVSDPASKVEDAWPCVAWPLEAQSIAFAVLCGCSSHKPTPAREQGHGPPTSQWEERQSIYSQVLQLPQ